MSYKQTNIWQSSLARLGVDDSNEALRNRLRESLIRFRERAEQLASDRKSEDVRVFDTWERLIDEADVDIVSICTAETLRREPFEAALGQGRHVLVEKPFCTSLDDARSMAVAAEKARKVAAICFSLRYAPGTQTAVAAVRAGDLGRLRDIGRPGIPDGRDDSGATRRLTPARARTRCAVGGRSPHGIARGACETVFDGRRRRHARPLSVGFCAGRHFRAPGQRGIGGDQSPRCGGSVDAVGRTWLTTTGTLSRSSVKTRHNCCYRSPFILIISSMIWPKIWGNFN